MTKGHFKVLQMPNDVLSNDNAWHHMKSHHTPHITGFGE